MINDAARNATPTIEVRYHFFPVAWPAEVTRELFELLVGPDGIYPATAWGNEGDDPLPTDRGDVVDLLTERYEASARTNRITLFTDRPNRLDSFELFRSEWHDDAGLGMLLHWPKSLRLSRAVPDLTSDDAIAALVRVAEITDSPLVEIDYRAGFDTEPLTLAARREHKRITRGRVHAKAEAGPWRGLTHIPWRLVLGPDVVAMFGTDRLAALDDEHAIDHGNGRWTLQTTADPADSITDAGRAAEREIIETLGTEYFADFDADRLAAVVPDFPAEVTPDDQRLTDRYGERLAPL